MRPLKLCFVCDFNSIHARKWVKYFCDRGDRVMVISSFAYPETDYHGAPVFSIRKALPWDVLGRLGFRQPLKRVIGIAQRCLPDDLAWFVSGRQIANLENAQLRMNLDLVPAAAVTISRIVKEFRPDLIQALRLYPEGLMAANAGVSPLVLMAWGQDISLYAERYPDVANLVRQSLPACVAYFTDNRRDMKDALRYGLSPDVPQHITPSGGGVDTAALDGSGSVLSKSRPDCLMTYRRTGGIFIDNTPPVRAIAELRSELGVDTRFVIFGDCGGPYYDQVRIVAKRVGVIDRVEFRPPFPYSELAARVAGYPLVVSSAVYDGTSNALLETMWLGGIPVCSDLEPIREWITDGENGFLFDLYDIRQIATKFKQAIDSYCEFERMRALNREIVRERADYFRCMSRVRDIYQSLV